MKRGINYKLFIKFIKQPFDLILLSALIKLGCLLCTIAAQITDWGSCTSVTCCHKAQQNFLGRRGREEKVEKGRGQALLGECNN